MGLLPSSMRRHLCCHWHHCPRCNGVAVVNAQVLLQSRRFVVVEIALLPLSQWCHCRPHWCCCPCHDGIIAIINAQVSLPLSQWRWRPHCAGAIANNIARVLSPLLHHCCLPYCADLFALTVHGCHHHNCTDVVALVKLACLHHCAGVVALVTLVLLPSVRWH
jgi:hypothetical protein